MAEPKKNDTNADLQATPGVAAERPAETAGFRLQQTMLRVKEPKRSLDFYTRVLGMTLVAKLPFPTMSFTLYFLAFCDGGAASVADNARDRTEACMGREGVLELTHNWGSEDSDWTAHDGNSDPKGFGHIGIEVPDVSAACARFKDMGVEFKKEPDAGSMKGLAFIKDPDGYSIEVLNATKMRDFTNWEG